MMHRGSVVKALEGVAAARHKWSAANTQFNKSVEQVMTRLLHESALNYMSVQDVARASGMTVKRIRALMRKSGLDPHSNRSLLAASAAAALTSNAELMGINPRYMDLTSPLAYLPMGTQLRQALEDESMRGVKEIPDAPIEPLVDVFKQAWHAADARGEAGGRTLAGITAVLAALNEAEG